jgi:hypothetical protein
LVEILVIEPRDDGGGAARTLTVRVLHQPDSGRRKSRYLLTRENALKNRPTSGGPVERPLDRIPGLAKHGMSEE